MESPIGSLHVRDAVGDVDILTEAHRGRRDEDLCGSSDGVGGRVGGNDGDGRNGGVGSVGSSTSGDLHGQGGSQFV
jgi:hypothetical protein